MKDERVQALDPASKLSVTVADCTTAAIQLARGHLCGSTAAFSLAQALAGVALLGAETGQADETVTLKLTCPGPLGGFLVECTEKGTLRGYTVKKVLNDFDGLGPAKDAKTLGATGTFEVIRSIPGAILASGAVATDHPGVAKGLTVYFTQSLQRRVKVAIQAAVDEEGVPTLARGVLVECPPDGDEAVFADLAIPKNIAVAPRTLLGKLGLGRAEIRSTMPLAFACRCSAERAQEILAALPAEDRAALPPAVDITCHMCGRTWTVNRPDGRCRSR